MVVVVVVGRKKGEYLRRSAGARRACLTDKMGGGVLTVPSHSDASNTARRAGRGKVPVPREVVLLLLPLVEGEGATALA